MSLTWCLHLNDVRDFSNALTLDHIATFEKSETIQPYITLAAQIITEQFGNIEFTRCYFGNEFCEHLIPSAKSLQSALDAVHAKNLSFTFLTPYVTNEGLNALRPLFTVLSSHNAEVVFNDWGVLNLLRREFPTLIPVQGRLLNKALRDPRVTTMYATAPAPTAAITALQQSNLDNESYTNLLAHFGVNMIEMDNLPQGNDLSFAERGINIAAYFPFGFISTSRVCMAAGLHHHKQEKFQPGAPCRHECQSHLLEYSYTNSPFDNRDQKFYLKGNSYFYAHTEAMLRALFAQAESGQVARLIFQPRLPMMEAR